ncbi:MAG: PH domain-containing protein [Chloroflexota bacterium]|nr:PH domain-containing protein [Chloroflexota bacterium]
MWDRIKAGAAEVASAAAEQTPKDSSKVIADHRRQLQQLQPYIRPGEILHAVFDMKGGGTGFMGITNKRIIVYDQAFLGKRKVMVTVPFSKITRIASEDESGSFLSPTWRPSSKLTVWVGSDSYDFDFRGADKAHTAYELIVDHIL